MARDCTTRASSAGSWYFFFDLPDLPETVVHANRWHFFRVFLRDARPAFTTHSSGFATSPWHSSAAST